MKKIKPIEFELVDTDADELLSPTKADHSLCKLTKKPIVNPPATLEELRERINKAANTSPAALMRRLMNNTDPNLN